jgi:hypothetical protein
MDHEEFDALTRTMADGGTTRRAALRFVSGGLLGVLAARLGLPEDAAATPKKRKRRPEPKRHDSLQAEGKRRKKRRKKPQEPPPLPPGCQQCNDCEMCQDGVCVPDVDLEGVRCQGSGAACGYCQFGQCAPSVVPPCADGVCPQREQCCSEEKRCPDRESESGWACVGKDDCCPDEKRCANGCVDRRACCPEDRPRCGQCGEICVNGTWQCSAQKPCGGECIPEDECCWENPPACESGCQRLVCVSGELQCQDLPLGWPCRLPRGVDGTCCNGQCTREALICPAYPWREFNTETCHCECPPGSIPDSFFAGLCCPAGYLSNWDGKCCDGATCVCHIGHSPYEDEQDPWGFKCRRNGA